MNSVLKQLNSCAPKQWVKLSELSTDRKYKILHFEKISTKFGDSIMVFLDDYQNPVILPQRFNKVISNLDEINDKIKAENLYMVTKPAVGEKNYIPVEFIPQ